MRLYPMGSRLTRTNQSHVSQHCDPLVELKRDRMKKGDACNASLLDGGTVLLQFLLEKFSGGDRFPIGEHDQVRLTGKIGF